MVRAVAGRRETYQPVRSVIARSSAPAAVARGFVEQVGLRRAYVADLDAIAGRAPDFRALAAIADAGLSLIVDAGCGDLERARDMAQFRPVSGPLQGVVVGLESLAAERSAAGARADDRRGSRRVQPGPASWSGACRRRGVPWQVAPRDCRHGLASRLPQDHCPRSLRRWSGGRARHERDVPRLCAADTTGAN